MRTQLKALLSPRRRLIMAIMLFVVLDLSTLVINRWLAEEMSRDAVAINLAGRQRMLSQQTTKALLQASDAVSTAEFEAAIGEFRAAFQLFEQTLTAFAEGGEAPGGDGTPVILGKVDGEAARVVEAARRLIAPLPPLLAKMHPYAAGHPGPAGEYMMQHNREILELMNRLTTELEHDSLHQASRLRSIQTGAFLLALANFLGIVFGMLSHVRRAQDDSQRWQELARHDPLTGLSNRKGFTEAGVAILTRAQVKNAAGVVVMLDLDGFKPINDRYGHAMGDRVLVKLAEKLATAARATDVVARLGGDEFAILCPTLQSTQDIEQFCERLLAAIASVPAEVVPDCPLGGSVGVARYPQDGYVLENLLGRADLAMYAAKNAGGRRWHID